MTIHSLYTISKTYPHTGSTILSQQFLNTNIHAVEMLPSGSLSIHEQTQNLHFCCEGLWPRSGSYCTHTRNEGIRKKKMLICWQLVTKSASIPHRKIVRTTAYVFLGKWLRRTEFPWSHSTAWILWEHLGRTVVLKCFQTSPEIILWRSHNCLQ